MVAREKVKDQKKVVMKEGKTEEKAESDEKRMVAVKRVGEVSG